MKKIVAILFVGIISVVAFAGCIETQEKTKNQNPTAVISSPTEGAIFLTTADIYFDGSASSDPDDHSLSYSWTSNITGGIGTKATFSKTLSEGVHTITLEVDDGYGGKDTAEISIIVRSNKPPVANAGGDKTVKVGDPVYFDGSGSSDQEGNLVKYSWDFDKSDGVGEDSTEISPRHTYGEPETYVVTLTVTDNDGKTDTDTCNVEVMGDLIETDADTIRILLFADNDENYNWDMPENVVRVVATLSWEEEDWKLEYTMGIGEDPDDSDGDELVSGSSSSGYIILKYEISTGTVEEEEWFVHIETLNEDEHRNESCEYTITISVCYT